MAKVNKDEKTVYFEQFKKRQFTARLSIPMFEKLEALCKEAGCRKSEMIGYLILNYQEKERGQEQ